MDRTSSPSYRNARKIVFGCLALLVAAAVAFVLRRPLMMPFSSGVDWHRSFNGVVLLTLAGLPLAALAAWVLTRVRRGEDGWRKSVAEVGIVYGTAPWIWMIMLPGDQPGEVPARLSLVPLRDIFTIIAAGPMAATMQIGGNLLVFAALGFFAPRRFAALASVPRILALAAGCSILVEVAQYVLRLDRVSSVDDVLLNAAGAGLAALASMATMRRTNDL